MKLKDYLKLLPRVIGRTIYWFYLKLKARNNELVKDIQGSKMILDLSSFSFDLKERNIFKQLALDGIREVESTKIIKNIIKPNDRILEIGANVGYYVLLEAKLLEGQGKIYAIEPVAENLNLLKRNLELNNISSLAEVYHLAVSDKKGEFPLYIANESNTHSMVEPQEKGRDSINIKTTTVDDFLEGKDKVDFIRMDVEGYECEIIKGMAGILQKDYPLKMFIELHPQLVGREKIINMLETLKKHGFESRHIIYHDTYLRRCLGHCHVHNWTIAELLSKEIFSKAEYGILVFFERS